MDEQDKQEAVRRLLAEARHDAPVPPDVAARLDATLAGLVAERSGSVPTGAAEPGAAQTAPVVDLAARRRRRRLTAFVTAAAAVVVVGTGVGQVLPTGPSGDDSVSASTDRSATSTPEPEKDEAGGTARQKPPSHDDGPTQLSARDTPVPALSAASSDVHVRRTLRAATAYGVGADTRTVDDACLADAPGRTVPVLWDGVDAVALWRPVGAAERIEITRCDGRLLRAVPLR